MEVLVVTRRWLLAGAVAMISLTGCAHGPRETVVAVQGLGSAKMDRALTPEERAGARPTTADMIYTIYSQNLFLGATPDQHFRDRAFVVTGLYNGINRRTPGRTWLELRTHDEGAFVYAGVGTLGRALPATLVPGQSVQLLCRCIGEAAGSPLLSACEQARPGTNE